MLVRVAFLGAVLPHFIICLDPEWLRMAICLQRLMVIGDALFASKIGGIR